MKRITITEQQAAGRPSIQVAFAMTPQQEMALVDSLHVRVTIEECESDDKPVDMYLPREALRKMLSSLEELK